MDAIHDEHKISSHEYTILTNKAIVKEEEGWFGNLDYKEIPLEKITSISKENLFKKNFLIIAIIFGLIGTWKYITQGISNEILVFYGIGSLFLILFILTAKKVFVVCSPTETISEKGRGSGEFIHKLREQIYK